MDQLREKVFASLDTAQENGYDMTGNAGMIALDLLSCDATYEGLPEEKAVEVEGYVLEWQKAKPEQVPSD